jgi:hypothetical protein
MLFPAFNKEKIELLQRFLEAQEREEKEKNDLQVAPGRRRPEPGAEASDSCAIALED